MIGKLVRKTFGEEVYVYISLNGTNVKIFVFHVSVHQNVTLSEEEFNNQIIGWLLWTAHLFPQFFLSLPNGSMNKVAHGEVMHESINMAFHSPKLTWLWLFLSAKSISIRDQQGIWHLSWSDQPATWWQIDYIRSLPMRKRKWQHFVLF